MLLVNHNIVVLGECKYSQLSFDPKIIDFAYEIYEISINYDLLMVGNFIVVTKRTVDTDNFYLHNHNV